MAPATLNGERPVTPTPRSCGIGPRRHPHTEPAPTPLGLASVGSTARRGALGDSLPDVGDTRSHDGRRGSTIAAPLEEKRRAPVVPRSLAQAPLHARTVDWLALA